MTNHIVAATALFLVACGSPHSEAAPRAQTAQTPQTAKASTAALDQALAPIALYPDSLLAQMLMSATDPAKVTELDAWLKSNTNLKGTPLQDAAVKAGFEPSFVALALFPQVVAKMAEQIAMTTALGQWFTNDKNAVFASIQRLRKQAKDVGTLKSTPQQDVETKTTSGGEQVIVIEPTNPQIVYVPTYNTQVVYTQPPSTTTVIVEDNDPDVAVAAGLIGFTAGVALGAAFNNNYYYGPYGWHGGAYMYNDGWNNYWDHREDAREDWMDHREDLNENRSDRLENTQEQRTDRRENTQEQRTDRQQNRTENRPASQTQRAQGIGQAQTSTSQTQRTNRQGSAEARGYGDGSRSTQSTAQRSSSGSSGRSDAFSGYSSGASQRSSSARGQSSRSSASRGGGGRRR
jgi:hypothetical protein